MSRWDVYQYVAVEPLAFCAFGIQRRETTAVFYDLWGITRGGVQSVLGTYNSLDEAKGIYDRLVASLVTEEG